LANVVVTKTSKGISADESGWFTLKGICDCLLDLRVSYTGYKSKEVKVHADHPGFLNIYLAPDAKLLQSVIIVGESDQKALVSQVSKSISDVEIEHETGASMGEILSRVGGVGTIETGSNVVKPVIHGLSSNRILILNNGIRFEGQQWGAEHAPAIDPMLAQRMEVIKGASSVRYGAGAIGGVILVLPPDLPETKEISGKVNLSGQINGRTITSSGMVEGNSINGIGWRVQGTYKRGGDLRTPDYYLTNTGVREYNFSAAVGKNYRNAEYEVFLSHFNTSLGILKATGLSESVEDLQDAINKAEPEGTGPFSYKISNPRQEVAHSLVKAKARWNINENALNLQYGYQNNKRKEFDIRRGNLVDIPSMDLVLNTHLLDFDLLLNGSSDHKLNLGLNTYYQKNSNTSGTQTIPFLPNYTLSAAGVYAIDKWDMDRIILEAGMRADYQYLDVAGRDTYNEVYRSALYFFSSQGILGLRYSLSEKDLFYVNIASGWRPPHVSELYSSGTHQSAASIEYGLLLDEENKIIDTDLVDIKNEQSIKSTISYEKHGQHLHLNVMGYYQVIDNYFYLKPFGLTTGIRGTYPYFRYRQTKALFSGFDIDLEYDISRHITLEGLYSYLYARDKANRDYFLYIPANRLNAGITYHTDPLTLLDHLEAFLKGEYVFKQTNAPKYVDPGNLEEVSEQDENFDFIPAPNGYFLLEAGFSLTKRWDKNFGELRISSTNLLNSQYRNYTNRLKYYADDTGRNIKMGIIYHF
jgi:iron complex outermembrane receptor protein